MTDPNTGEVFASNYWLPHRGEKTLVTREVAIEKSKKWFESFLRGIENDNDIYFSIMIKEYKDPQLPLFPSAFP